MGRSRPLLPSPLSDARPRRSPHPWHRLRSPLWHWGPCHCRSGPWSGWAWSPPEPGQCRVSPQTPPSTPRGNGTGEGRSFAAGHGNPPSRVFGRPHCARGQASAAAHTLLGAGGLTSSFTMRVALATWHNACAHACSAPGGGARAATGGEQPSSDAVAPKEHPRVGYEQWRSSSARGERPRGGGY